MKTQTKIKFSLLIGIGLFMSGICPGAESPDIGSLQIFPPDNPWNWDISSYTAHPNSENFIDNIGRNGHLHPDFGTVWDGAPNGIPYCVVGNNQPWVPVTYTAYGYESDSGPFPVPLSAPVEGGPDSDGDRHVIAVDKDNAMLYELYRAFPQENRWEADSGAKYDLKSNALRPEGWTSADAAGLPIFPGLVRYEEVYLDQEIDHALRFTVSTTQRKYIYPARHFASSSTNPDLPPMGLRLRLKEDFDISGFSEPVQVILVALKKYGMIVADNGSDWFISGAPDDRWDDEVLGELKTVDGSNFEAVRTVDAAGNPIFPAATGVSETPGPSGFGFAVFPNPFNLTATLRLDLPVQSYVHVKLSDILGREMMTVTEGWYPAGHYDLMVDGTSLPSGIYLIYTITDHSILRRKIILLK